MIEEIIKKQTFEFDNRMVEIGIKTNPAFGKVLYEKIEYFVDKEKNLSRWRKCEDVTQSYNMLSDYYNKEFDKYFHGKKNG